MKIFTGEIPECHITPNEAVQTYDGEIAARVGAARRAFKEGQFSILNQCKEVPWEPIMVLCQQAFVGHWTFGRLKKKLEQFIQSEIKKQEKKSHD